MPTAVDAAFLDKALAELETARKWTPRTISKLEALINSDDPWAVYRVDPLRFAEAKGIPEQEAIDLFLHAAHLGLFEIEWRLMCPMCSDTVSSCRSMSTVQSRCYCQLCQMTVDVQLDNYIAVSFNLSSRVRPLVWHEPENLSVEDLLLRYRIDQQAGYEGMPRMADMLRGMAHYLDYVQPGASHPVEAEVPAGWAMVAFDASQNLSVIVAAKGEPTAQRQNIRAELVREGWKLTPEAITPGPISITFVNTRARRVPVAFYTRPYEGDGPRLVLGKFLSGNRLVNNQTFRTLFRAETLPAGEGLAVRDLTLLFTDLKGSTELYERVGDLAAFALVQQHFEHLRRAVQEQEGAVVKTIGDAVMASFVRPEQAVRAALAMFREIKGFNQKRGKRELILKVGLHSGHAIAVTLNERLDYFGQTVNLAARVQGVSNADEICMTEDVFNIAEVQASLKGMPAAPETAILKGIQGEVPIRRVRVG